MSDYRNPDFDPFDPNDPYRRDTKMNAELRPSNVATGWIVGAVFVAAILAVTFGMSHQRSGLGTTTASNDITKPAAPPAMTHMVPPTGAPPAAPKPPISPVVPTPGQSGGGQ